MTEIVRDTDITNLYFSKLKWFPPKLLDSDAPNLICSSSFLCIHHQGIKLSHVLRENTLYQIIPVCLLVPILSWVLEY